MAVRHDPRAGGPPTAAESELRVESREQLLFLLTQAAELEHGLMCEYLFAIFSLKRTADEGVSEAQLERIRAWEQAIAGVAMQEMLHLSLATNLLCSLGAPPHFDRPDFPILSGWYPPGVQIALIPFGERALKHFLYLERPEGMHLEDAEGFAAIDEAEPLTDGRTLMAVQADFGTVGHLYRGIESGIARLAKRDGEENVFIGPRRAQASASAFRWPEIIPVVDLASARRAIDNIIEQGEGARGDWRTAHFGIFKGVLDEYRALRAEDPSFEPARDAVPAYVHAPDHADAPVAVATNPLTVEVLDLFDAAYETALQALTRTFLPGGETLAQERVLARTATRLMSRALRPIGICMTRLPLGDPDGPRAGPAFRMVPQTFTLLPFRDAAWKMLTERVGAIADRADELAVRGSLPELAQVATEVRTLRDALVAGMPARWGSARQSA